MKISATTTVASFFASVANGSPFTIDQVLTDTRDETCQQTEYIQRNQRMICKDYIPRTVPDTVDETFLIALHGYRVVTHGFCKISWTKIKMLSISNDFDDPSDSAIVDYAFDCLNKVEILKLSIGKLSVLTANSCYSLLNVRLLDLTACIRLDTPALTIALSLHTVVPKLNQLILSNIGSAYSGIQLSQEFIDVLAQRNITELHLSSSFVDLKISRWEDFVKHYRHLTFRRHIFFIHPTFHVWHANRYKLQILAGHNYPQRNVLPKNVTIKNAKWLWNSEAKFDFFSRVPVLFLNNALPVDHYIYIYNSTFILAVNNSVTELHLGRINIPIFELELIFVQIIWHILIYLITE